MTLYVLFYFVLSRCIVTVLQKEDIAACVVEIADNHFVVFESNRRVAWLCIAGHDLCEDGGGVSRIEWNQIHVERYVRGQTKRTVSDLVCWMDK